MVIIDKKGVLVKYINIIKDIYFEIVTNIKTYGGLMSNFSIMICPFLLGVVKDKFTKIIHDETFNIVMLS